MASTAPSSRRVGLSPSFKSRLNARPPRSRSRSPSAQTSMTIPDRFKVDDDEEDGADTAGDPSADVPMQSFYGLLALGQGKGGLPSSLPQTTEESDDEDHEAVARSIAANIEANQQNKSPAPKPSRHNVSESRPQSTWEPTTAHNQDEDPMTQSQFLLPSKAPGQVTKQYSASASQPTSSPIISRKLQAQANAELEASRETPSRRSQESERERSIRERADLPSTLKNMFQFDSAEELVHEFKCFYVQNVLLQGHFFITQHHICFYAYLPRKGSAPIKTGHLAKQGKRDPRYSRHWFILKGDVLSYYTSAANPHFPAGTVDLRNAISAELVAEKGKAKHESTTFTITMEHRTYHMKADSVTSANEWIKQLQRVIFRSHNDGNAVKISVPIANLVDVEKSPITDFTETVRLRAVDNDKTFSVEEYFFTFLDRGGEAFRMLRAFADENLSNQRIWAVIARDDAFNRSPRPRNRSPVRSTSYFDLPESPAMSPTIGPETLEPVRSTLSPLEASKHSPRTSGEFGRSSGELSRASLEKTRKAGDRVPRSPGSPSHDESINASSESFAPSSGRSSSPVAAAQDHMTSSQFLTGDSAFQAPTMHRGTAQRNVSKLTEGVSPIPGKTKIRTEPPTRTPNEQSVAITQSKAVPESSAEVKGNRGISTPLFDLAGRFRDQGKRMGSYLGTSPKDYYNRFSGALAGGKRHYSEAEGLMADDRAYDEGEEAGDHEEHRQRFLDHFALPDTENLEAVFYCSLLRVLPLYGKIYVGSRHLCFRSLLYGTKTKVNLPFADIETVRKARSFRWSYPGMIVVIRGHEEIFFDFSSTGDRDDCVVTLLKILEGLGNTAESTLLTEEEYHAAEMAAAEHELLQQARGGFNGERSTELRSYIDPNRLDTPAILFDDASASILEFKPQESLRIVCLTIGSRGDVQPYIALCKGLLKEGHRPCIATHAEFEHFVTRYGIDFVPVAGDPAELMRICVEYGMFTPSFVWQANSKFRGWLDGLLSTAYEACKGADLLIESPSAMAGIHIAEALKIPYFRAFTMPWTRTRAYPHAFAVPNKKMGGGYNMMSYIMFDHMFWSLTSSQMNKWRAKVLGLKPTSLEKLQPNKVPFLYNFSPSVVTPPLDFSDWVRVTGYWFLDEADSWTPPSDLVAFIQKAREDKQKLVCIGFGSVVVNDARRLTEQIIQAVAKADVRCILSKGWSDRLNVQDAKLPEVKLPDFIFRITAAPHDWLFRQVDAVVHHGGAGTTGASLRAGVPTIIKPFFGDQFFFATRVEDLGVGIFLKSISVNGLGKALWIATHDDRIQTKARILGERIRAENGVDTAIKAIYRDMEYAKTLIKQRQLRPGGKSKMNTDGSTLSPDELDDEDEEEEEEEESWTFVEQESDTEMSSRRDSQGVGTQTQGLGSMGLLGLRRGRYGLA